jgi:DNA-binding MurR/RpiR family transcriptional regulator
VGNSTPEQREGSEVLLRVQSLLPSLQPSDARVAQTFLDDPLATIYRSVSEVAELAGTSTATVVRCSQKLGFAGFQQLKLALAADQSAFNQVTDEETTDGAIPWALARVASLGAQAVRDAGMLVDPVAFDSAVSALATANRVLLVGVGTSAPVTQDAAYRFRAIGLSAEAPIDVHVQHVAARQLGPGAVCIGVSYNGSTRETLASVEYAKASGATTVVLTSFCGPRWPSSPTSC